LKEALSKPVVESLDLHALGRHEVGLWRESLRRLVEFRDSGKECRFFDVSFNEIQSDPLAAVEDLYGNLGDDLDAGTREKMVEWWSESSKDRRHGSPPDPTAYGLNVQSLRSEFAFYHDRFAIPPDSVGSR
jgi:hypothetical protein